MNRTEDQRSKVERLSISVPASIGRLIRKMAKHDHTTVSEIVKRQFLEILRQAEREEEEKSKRAGDKTVEDFDDLSARRSSFTIASAADYSGA